MRVGDLVIRKVDVERDRFLSEAANQQREKLGAGIVLSTHMAGSPVHRCLKVYYGKTKQVWEIAESLMERVNALET